MTTQTDVAPSGEPNRPRRWLRLAFAALACCCVGCQPVVDVLPHELVDKAVDGFLAGLLLGMGVFIVRLLR